MFDHPATQENVDTLKKRGAVIIGPAEGHLASGLSGPGRMLEPMEILGYARLALGQKGLLANKRVIITAGGTQEPLDPVRVLTNRSSGKQGYALAQAALDAGMEASAEATVFHPGRAYCFSCRSSICPHSEPQAPGVLL